jgi:hypothetical protein
MDDVFTAADNIHPTTLVALDISAAYNMISKDVLLQQLATEFSVTGDAIGWLRSHLTGRFQFVKMDEHSSNVVSTQLHVRRSPRISPGHTFAYGKQFSHGQAHRAVQHKITSICQRHPALRSQYNCGRQPLLNCSTTVVSAQ